jgi:hypothetical protein
MDAGIIPSGHHRRGPMRSSAVQSRAIAGLAVPALVLARSAARARQKHWSKDALTLLRCCAESVTGVGVTWYAVRYAYQAFRE